MKPRIRSLALLLATFFVLGNVAACFDDDDDDAIQPTVQPFTLTQSIDQGNVGAAVGLEFDFADLSAVHSSLSGPTTVSFPSSSTLEFSNGGNTASGNVTFGSCIVSITSSTIPGLSSGTQITIDPCTVTVTTTSQIEIGSSGSGSVSINFGNANSSSQTTTVTITNDGTVTVNGEEVGEVDEGGNVTGGTGASS